MLDDLLKFLKDKHGEDSAFKLNDESISQFTGDFVPTGCAAVDYTLGIPGLPFGRIVEVTGEVSTGKTFLGLTILQETLKIGGVAVIIDFEHALDPSLIKMAGLDMSKCIMLQPACIEEAFQQFDTIHDYMQKKGSAKPLTVVLDSLAAAPTKQEIESEYLDHTQMGYKAKFLSLALRKISASISQMKMLLVIINQMREKIGTVYGQTWTTPGGLAIPYHSSIRLLMQKKGDLKSYSTGEVKGITIRVLCIKNKFAPPLKSACVNFIFDRGFDNIQTILDILTDQKILSKSSSTYSYKDVSFKASTFLKKLEECNELKEELQRCVPYLYQTYILQSGQSMESMTVEDQES